MREHLKPLGQVPAEAFAKGYWARVLVLALGYSVAGRVGLELAVVGSLVVESRMIQKRAIPTSPVRDMRD